MPPHNPSPISKLESLGKILRQEEAGGFQDETVIGGLDRFLYRWDHEFKPTLGDLGSYSLLTPPQRQEWTRAATARLADAVRSGGEEARAGRVPPGSPGHKATSRGPATRGYRTTVRLDDDVTRLPRMSSRVVPKLKRLGVEKVRDLLFLLPHRHNDFARVRKVSELEPGQEQTVVVTVWEASQIVTARGGRRSAQAILGDDTGNVRAIWFNRPYMARTLSPGTQVVISGRVGLFRGQPVFESPEYELLQGQEQLVHTGRLVPVYPLTAGITQRTLRRLVKRALDSCISQVEEHLPQDLRHRTGLIGLQNAIAQVHYPDSAADWNAARRRLAFDELFHMQLAFLRRKRQWQQEGDGIALQVDTVPLEAFLGSLPFSLTGAQARVLDEILEDIKGDRAMRRLLQGDVGSGKTVVAVASLLVAALNGYQGALMAPTEILAEQHFMTVSRLFSGFAEPAESEYLISARIDTHPRPIAVGLLLGSLSQRAKDEMHRRIADGSVDLVIGTQALIQASVEMPKLAVVVVDEQHRFGVLQRSSLREKGTRPHLLVMSATPIPRSLALTLYGDLDFSVIDELPPGRRQIRTRWVEPARREAAYNFVRKEAQAGRQAFVICPLVEESEVIQSRAATQEYERLARDVFPELKLGLLHGRMPFREKERVMGQFQGGELDILVSTPVVEVGVDVPNATVMLIDGADRFGLAQLHQFRGRVGRGSHQSYCLLLADSPGEEARARLKTVERVQDGFELAEEDLRLRGPGDYLGTRQSGFPMFRAARLGDQDLVALSRREAARLLDSDPELSSEAHAALAAHLERSLGDPADGLS